MTARHYCRNPRCKMKLAEPVDTERRAFCTPGCHTSFYKSRCRVCEDPIHVAKQRLGPKRILCRKDDCRREYRRNPDLYEGPNAVPATPLAGCVRISSEVPVKWAFKAGDKAARGWRWEQFGGEHWLFTPDDEVQARLIPDGELYIVRLSPGIDYGVPSPLEDARRLAISLALARLPVEPRYRERLARLNELPPNPPQNLVPWTATYLAGLAAVKSEAPSIVPDLPSDGGDLEIPSFLRRPIKEEVV
jgi:hypothetical protein